MATLYIAKELYFDNNCMSRDVEVWFQYPLTEVGEGLIEEWHQTTKNEDHNLSGVLADYLTDHRDELLTEATGPSDPAERLDALIEYLRRRFNSQFGEQQ